ncbi:MAG: ATP-dependent DNA helicase RecG [Paracidovorax wautersii]|uniref:ATP-dependent DNA helicase RecG n=1 Tax=Paracidovorax wautersii TaxID=1177982 RepID=A0A7V8FLU6_9BURK|nr:MAG: ATP-dependent DNA helicase RecG [Paracidovorax wautersii]
MPSRLPMPPADDADDDIGARAPAGRGRGKKKGAADKTAAAAGSGPRDAVSQQDRALAKLGLVRDIDLALHLPLRYEDETRITRLADAREGEVVQIEAMVIDQQMHYQPRRQLIVKVDDGSETCTLRFFNFYPSQAKSLAVGKQIRARGELRGHVSAWAGSNLTMMHPVCRAAGGALPRSLTPVYPTVAGLAQPAIRQAVAEGLARAKGSGLLAETLPAGNTRMIGHHTLYSLETALGFLHHPSPDVNLQTLEDHSHPAWQRLKAEELLAQQLSQQVARLERASLQAPVLVPRSGGAGAAAGLHEQLLAALPFALTGAQHRVVAQIAADLRESRPMHRLLQGDVGSGKTVVAALAAAICMDAGWQCALMVPTEILAEQHFRKLVGWLEPLGVKVAWLAGGQKGKAKREVLESVASGEAQLVVGTHAVIQDSVVFRRLALAIIDEQHRFGVAQRLALRSKMAAPVDDPESPAGPGGLPPYEPHLLMMSATPIPRTLAMSYYADLDVSTIDELPPGRSPIVTRVISQSRRDELIGRIRDQVDGGRQVYWVCPLIEESEALDLATATDTFAELGAALPGVLVGLLHSRMAPAEKKAVMDLFSAGQMGVLVATTVIEVGVDVPNASLMVVEHAERFGLSQLHQLRGRVGRGAAASACVLLYAQSEGGRLSESARARLRAMAETQDGFEIARRDLEIRGPGEFLGSRQSGAALLRFADLETDSELLDWARELAPRLLADAPEQAAQHIERWLGGKAEFLKA